MAAKILVLGHDRDYYSCNAGAGSVTDAIRKVYEGSQGVSHGAAFLLHVADCNNTIPANRLHPYGASFPKHVVAAPDVIVVIQILRLIDELLAEADDHHASYILIHSLEITENAHNGCGLLAWVQMLNDNTQHRTPSKESKNMMLKDETGA